MTGLLDPVVPTSAQLAWQRAGIGMFFHIGVNTFAGLEWSDGTVPAEAFAPTRLDTDQWVQCVADLGARYAIVTAKHHDGFCLWPTATTDYSVASSPWRAGSGDLVAEFAESCRRFGVGFGVYLSPWDRNCAVYDDPDAYDDFYCAQLAELLAGYGPVTEIWFDGAGSEGRTYDWDRIDEVCRSLQPDAMRFNLGDYTIRWVGNEDGVAHDPVRYVVDARPLSVFDTADRATGEARYAPPECDVSIRPGWFYHENEQPKSLDELLAIHESSVGLGASLLLNVPPDRSGLVSVPDRTRVREFAAALHRRFGDPVEAVVVAADAGEWIVTGPAGVSVAWLELVERLDRGQRVSAHSVLDASGRELVSAGTVGIRRLHRLPERTSLPLTIRLNGDDPTLEAVLLHPRRTL